MIISSQKKPTEKQILYIEQLLIDCYLFERNKRNNYLSKLFNREIKYLDELNDIEAGIAINKLKTLKEEIKGDKNDSRIF